MAKSKLDVKIARYEGKIIPGLPRDGKAIVVSNSSLSTVECPQKWWLSQGIGLRSDRETLPQSFGNAFHRFSEHFHTWAMLHDGEPYQHDFIKSCFCNENPGCSSCGGTGWGPVSIAREQWEDAAEQGLMDREIVPALVDKLERTCHGYVTRWKGFPFMKAEVIAIEQPLAMPILRPSGEVFRPAMDIVQTSEGWALAASLYEITDSAIPQKRRIGKQTRVRWPWYYIGTIDLILRDRETGQAIIPDIKTSVDTGKFEHRFKLDPQLPSYARLVDFHKSALGVSGVLLTGYDVVSSSYQYDALELKPEFPKADELKAMMREHGLDPKGKKVDEMVAELGISPKPKLSTAATRTVPSWRFEEAVNRLGLKGEEVYEQHILDLQATTDQRLYRRLYDTISQQEMMRWQDELFGRAAIMYDHYRIASQVAIGEVNRYAAFPRIPVCLAPGRRCPLESACTHGPNSPGYIRKPVLAWRTSDERSATDDEDNNDLGW